MIRKYIKALRKARMRTNERIDQITLWKIDGKTVIFKVITASGKDFDVYVDKKAKFKYDL